MGIRAAIEVNKNTVFGTETNTYYVPCGGLAILKKVRKNLTTAKDPAGLVKKLSTYVKKGMIRYDGHKKLVPQECYPFIEYILRVNVVDDSSFELEPVYETVNKRQFACASKRSTTTFVKGASPSTAAVAAPAPTAVPAGVPAGVFRPKKEPSPASKTRKQWKFDGEQGVWLAGQQYLDKNKLYQNRGCFKLTPDGGLHFSEYIRVPPSSNSVRWSSDYVPPSDSVVGVEIDTSKHRISVRNGLLYIANFNPQGLGKGRPYIVSSNHATPYSVEHRYD